MLSVNQRSGKNATDDLDRLVAERIESAPFGTNPPPRQMTYAYDLAGNRLRKTDTASGAVDYTLGLGDRLASFTGGAYEYDVAGCVTNISGGASSPSEPLSRALAWNSQYQLLSVSTNGVLAESYTWDPLGRRATTTTAEGTIRHVYDGDECIADLDETGAVVRSYVWGPGIDNLLAIRVGEQTFYALTDHQNTVHGFVDASGSLVARYIYDAWGTVLESSVSVPALADNRYLFQGREYSWATGLYNFRARWYDPITGRWLSKDPIGLSGGMNLYVFCENNPVVFVEPSGLDSEESGFWDVIQTSLDVAGVADPTLLCDGANAVIYLFRGQFRNAGISVLACFPYVGDAAKGLKYGSKAVKNGTRMLRGVERGVEAAGNLKKVSPARLRKLNIDEHAFKRNFTNGQPVKNFNISADETGKVH